MRLRLALAIATVLCGTMLLSAQDTTGSIRGVIIDPSGAVVPGATVTITNIDQNVVAAAIKSGAEGQYNAPFLPVGRYSITVEASGFAKMVITGIQINVNDKLTRDVSLKLAGTEQQVNVQEAPVQVDLQSPQAAGLMTGNQVRELPVSSRNFVQLVALQPGVTTDMASSNLYVGASNPTGFSNQINISVNGNRPTQNNWLIDGADNFDRGANLTLLNYPSIDSIAEFKVLRSNYLPEHGRSSAGEITVVTRGGTNNLHGSVYEFFRNDKLNANDFFLNRAGEPRQPQRWNDFGFTLGGPIKKDKTFFFYSQEWRRIVYYPAIGPSAQLPTTAQMSGNFASPVCVQFDATGNCTGIGTTITNINPVAAAYIKDIYSKLPAANNADGSLTMGGRALNYYREEAVRIDHNFSKKLNIFGRFSDDSIPTLEPRGLYTGLSLPGVATTNSNAPGRSLSVHGTSAMSDTLLNDFGYTFSWGAVLSDPTGTLAKKSSPDINPNLVYPSSAATVPFIDLCAYTDVACGPSLYGFGAYRDYNKNHTWFDNLSKTHGHHTFKFGATYNYYTKDENSNNYPTFYFLDTAPGAAALGANSNDTFDQLWANFLLGRVFLYNQTNMEFRNLVHQHQLEIYGQDDWRVTPRLTLSYGLRYSLFMSPTYGNGLLSTFDPKLFDPSKAPTITPDGYLDPSTPLPYANGMIIGGKNSPFGQAVQRTPHLDFAPRFGFAWDPFGDSKTSVRGGYGIFFDSPAVNSVENFQGGNVPLAITTNIYDTNLSNPGQTQADVSFAPPTVGGPDPNNWKLPYSQMFSLDVQRQLSNTMSLDVGYYGNLGRHLVGVVDINMPHIGDYLKKCLGGSSGTSCTAPFVAGNYQLLNLVRPYQGFDAINMFEPVFTSNYNSLQAQFQKHFTENSLITANYTWSHTLTTASGDYRAAQYTYDLRGDYGNADFDRRHVFTTTYVYTLPFHKSQQGLVGHLAGGWELSGLAYVNSGRHYTASMSSCNSHADPAGLGLCGNTYSGARPDMIGDPNNSPHTINNWINKAAFAYVPAGEIRPGDARRGVVVGPGLVRWDASLFKNTKINERLGLQFRAEAFNVLNHTNLGIGSPGSAFRSTSFTSSLFGRIGTAYEPRQIQLALKLLF